MAGSLGILGVLLDVSVKVLPAPAATRTLTHEVELPRAIDCVREWSATSRSPVATCWFAGRLHARFEGAPQTLDDITRRLGGETMYEAGAFWSSIREQTLAFFRNAPRLWRLQLPAVSAPVESVPSLVEWHGAQRWVADAGGLDWRSVAADAGATRRCSAARAPRKRCSRPFPTRSSVCISR
jgi:glycolate oxidase FAD binding subunit